MTYKVGDYVRYDARGKLWIWGQVKKVYPAEMTVDGESCYDIISGGNKLDLAVHSSVIYGNGE